jgi:acyl-CoA reductase-like NAD-dependent aldehyde dehydrogenase
VARGLGRFTGAASRHIPESRLDEAFVKLKDHVGALKVDAATDPDVQIGPIVSQKQWERVQSYIRTRIGEGAVLLGIGREYGTFGLDAFLEPRAILS